DWFNNLNFRKAIAHAIDREDMIKSIYLGVGSPICSSYSGDSIYYNHSLFEECPSKANLTAAKELLKQGGFRLDEKKQELYDKKGNRVSFTLYTNATNITDTTSPRELMASLIKEQLDKLGIEVNLKVLEFNSLVVRLMQSGDWQTCIIGFGGADLYEPNSAANVLKSNSRLHIFDQRPQGKTVSDLRPWEAEIDKLVNEGTSKISFNERKAYYYRIQEILWTQQPMIYLVTPEVLFAINDKQINNVVPSNLAGSFYNLEQWF
ncbi:MAG TPA: ABC transporter substrate-binding protein, partial [Vampirovibrionales bacterium]